VEDAIAIARQIAEALEAAHERGIVHRDLKPANVKVRPDGTVKVLDFGLAKALDPATAGGQADLAHSPTLTHAATQAGLILGTAAYMSPEQAKGAAVDKRADIWAFGVVLWEMLTGNRLFAGDSVAETLAGVLKTEIDLAALPADVPAALRQLLRRCLERSPRNRLHDIADARIAIDEALAGPAAAGAMPDRTTPGGVTPLWRRVLPWLGGAAAGLALATAAGWRTAKPAAGPSAAAASMRTLVAAGVSVDPSVSPDGRTLAFESLRDGESRIWIKDLASGSESVLVPRTSFLPAFSPDGTTVLFVTEDEVQTDLYRISLATREERLAARDAVYADWSSDGRSIVFLRDYDDSTRGAGEMVAAELDGGRERLLYRDAAKRMNDPRWSPDGKRIAVVLNSFQSGTTDLLGLLDVGQGRLEEQRLDPLGRSGMKIRGLAWISPRRLALLVLDKGEQQSPSGRIALLDLDTRELSSLLPVANVGWGLDVAGKGSLIVGVGSSDQNLQEARRSAAGRWSEPRIETEGPFRDRQPVYSPDGRWLLFTSNRSGNLDVWRRDRAGGATQRLTDHGAEDWDPALSPDGGKLLFSSNRSGRYQIWIAEADGSAPRQVTDLENAQNPTMTADGAWIVFVLQDAGENRNGIWKIRPDGTDATLVAAGGYLVPATSPDGRFVAVQGSDRRRVLRLSDGALLDTDLDNTARYRWSVESGRTYLWALALTDQGTEVRRFPFDPERGAVGPAEVVLAGAAVRAAETLGVARDGSAFTFASVANRRGQLIRIDGLEGLEP
jgi:Tol biopolymer transport system component